MSDKLKLPAIVVLAIVAVALLVFSGYRSLKPAQQTDDVKMKAYMDAVNAKANGSSPYQQKPQESQTGQGR